MSIYSRMTFRLTLALLLLAGGVVASAAQPHGTALAAGAALNHANAPLSYPGSWYGASSTLWMVDATIGIWPQQVSNACGVDTAIGMVNYDALNAGASMPEPSSSNPEASIITDNQKYPTVSAETISQWGYSDGSQYNTTAGYTDIANDFGTDPRSVAYMAWWYSISNRYFHNYLYRWNFNFRSNPGYSTTVAYATTFMAQGIETWGEPAVAFINAGQHAVLVTGVYSLNDPEANIPADISALSIRDPEGTPNTDPTQDTSHYTATITDWETGNYHIPYGYGTYSLWSEYYGSNNPGDPDVSVNAYPASNPDPYLPPPHWLSGFVWAQRDNNTGPTGTGTLGQWDPDWTFNAWNDTYMSAP